MLNNAGPAGEPRIRRQLLLAALFPLIFFGLAAILLGTSALHNLFLEFTLQRNTALAQVTAASLNTLLQQQLPVLQDAAAALASGSAPSVREAQALHDLSTFVQTSQGPARKLYVIDPTGQVIVWPAGSAIGSRVTTDLVVRKLISDHQPRSVLHETPWSTEQVIVSLAPVAESGWELMMEEKWSSIVAPAVYYQWGLAALLALGTALSLIMLAISADRVLRPLTVLADQTSAIVPGGIFHPLKVEGPLEVRGLISAFNKMVIRLAEQQGALRQYAAQVLHSQEEERQRLSRDLHDETVQDLIGFIQRIELCRNEIERDPAAVIQRLDELYQLAQGAVDNVRRMSNDLRSSILDDLGLPIALNSLCDDLAQSMPAVQAQCESVGDERRLDPEIELAIFRIVQEALTNVRRHAAAATRVKVQLCFEARALGVTIQDNGPGFEVPNVRALIRAGHLGLAGMYERARLLGGELDIASNPDTGTTITLQLPVS
ncbi:MAG: ATP-binding protein [Chloroflexi bacterium]|nr:ATP-binding protein [Chloroflexota bacterium]